MATDTSRMRLDRALVARGLAASRARAQRDIAAGGVSVGGVTVTDPAHLVKADASIDAKPAHPWVSRGGIKLATALDHFRVEVKGLLCLDVGASTGGFTHVLLERGARRVIAVDVGRDQFHADLRGDPRVLVLEGFDARRLTSGEIDEAPSLIVADVSFISVTKALPAALVLAAPGAAVVVLVKPQFEVGPQGVGRGGIVRDAALRQAAVVDVESWLTQRGWTSRGVIPSPISGGDGNEEYLLVADHA